MNIKVRVHGYLRCYLPSNSKNTLFLDVPEGTTVGDLFKILNFPPNEIPMSLVNGRLTSISYTLKAEDRVDLYPTITGG